MIETNRVVVRLADGGVLKGTTVDFFPNRPTFHLRPRDGGEPVEIHCSSLKALFFVKSFEGDRRRRDLRTFLAGPPQMAKGNKIAVHFADGELLTGYSMNYSREKEGFVVFPADPRSNNLRIYVVSSAALEIATGPAANSLVERLQVAEKLQAVGPAS